VLIDEISEGLQPSVIERLSAVLRGERDAMGTSILIVEQNVVRIVDRRPHAVLKLGEISDRGSEGGQGRSEDYGSIECMSPEEDQRHGH
jgi:branched-chain amino acid transport system ATP-binding protein